MSDIEAYIAVKAVFSGWRPAQRFWNVFQIHDPAGLNPVAVRSNISAACYEARYREVQQAKPQNHQHLAEKLKVAAALGLTNGLRRCSPTEGVVLRNMILAVMTMEATNLLQTVNSTLLADQLVAPTDTPGDGGGLLAHLHCNLVAGAGEAWVKAVIDDFACLAAKSDKVVVESMF